MKWIVNCFPELEESDMSVCIDPISKMPIPPLYESKKVLVALDDGITVTVDRLCSLGLHGKPFWDKYGNKVVAWKPMPLHPLLDEAVNEFWRKELSEERPQKPIAIQRFG